MRKTILMTALIGATLTAMPAAAQPGYDRGYGYGNGAGQYHDGARQELWRLSQRVDRGVRQGDLNPREADYLRREIAQLRHLDQRYSRGGYSGWERRDLDQRVDWLARQVRFERNDWARNDRGPERDYDRGDRRW